jgi:hypothetical protein
MNQGNLSDPVNSMVFQPVIAGPSGQVFPTNVKSHIGAAHR